MLLTPSFSGLVLLALLTAASCREASPTVAASDASKPAQSAAASGSHATSIAYAASATLPPNAVIVPPAPTSSAASANAEDVSKQAIQCLNAYAKPRLEPADVKALVEHGLPNCFVANNPSLLARQGAGLPHTLGTDPRNGKLIEVLYTCSDLCPAYGVVVVRYKDTPKDACCAAGGHPEVSMGGGATRVAHHLKPGCRARRLRSARAAGSRPLAHPVRPRRPSSTAGRPWSIRIRRNCSHSEECELRPKPHRTLCV